jgi:glycerate dehydrogenase
MDKELMDACPTLKLICIAATGLNNVDLEYAKQKGIAVKNVLAYSTESVVQHTFSMLFYLMGYLPYYTGYVAEGQYTQSRLFTHHGKPFHELAEKRYGIIGLGTIGKRVAEVATVFKAKVNYYSPSGKNMDTGFIHVSLDKLLMESDIISIHCPLNDSTRNLIGYAQLQKMKSEAILINAGRGGIVNETDLARALNEQIIGAAGLDVMEKEPPEPSNPLLSVKFPERLLVTPHIAWASVESRERLVQGVIRNIKDFLEQG